jgi:hypothetical protein
MLSDMVALPWMPLSAGDAAPADAANSAQAMLAAMRFESKIIIRYSRHDGETERAAPPRVGQSSALLQAESTCD